MYFDVRLIVEATNRKCAIEKASTVGEVRTCVRVPKTSTKSSAGRSERAFAEFLTEWLGGRVVRSPGSGSMKAICGDFVGVEPKSADFFSAFCVELKTVPSAKYTSVLDKDFLKFHDEVVSKTFDEGINSQRVPIIVFKAKRFECVSVPWKLATLRNLPFLLRVTEKYVTAIIEFTTFFKENPDDLKLLASEVLKDLTAGGVYGV